MSEKHIYWVGPRESDIYACKDIFYGSITLFGSNSDGNIAMCNFEDYPQRVDHNARDDKKQDDFLRENILQVLADDPDAVIYLYNGNAFRNLGGLDHCRDRFICLNDPDLMTRLNNKAQFRKILEGKVTLLESHTCQISDCNYYNLRSRFGMSEADAPCRFVVQAPVASGGSGTFILDRFNEKTIEKKCKEMCSEGEAYIVSIYQEHNVSVNIHAIIFDDDIFMLPASIQVMREDSDRLMYRGADFIAYRGIDAKLRARFEADSRIFFEQIRELGYRGVCGVDAIIYKDQVRLLEINNRFQSSTGLINYALRDNGLRSVQEINMDAFNPDIKKADLKEKQRCRSVEVNYSNFTFIANDMKMHAEYVYARIDSESHIVCKELDGYCPGQNDYVDLAPLYRIVFDTNIVWVSEEGTPFIHENVCDPSRDMRNRIIEGDQLAVKIALMTQGVTLTERALALQTGGIREGTNNAVDMEFNGIVVNAPYNTRFAALSPFWIDVDDRSVLHLYYYNQSKPIDRSGVTLFPTDPMASQTTSSGMPFGEVAYLSTDRLRVHLTNDCMYKNLGVGCRFCNMRVSCGDIPIEDIEEVVRAYCDNPSVKHFLVGGQSLQNESMLDKLVKVIELIANYSLSNIYAMVLPYDDDIIYDMFEAGLTEIACNIEIFDPELALKYMPGKGKIDRQRYFDTLEYATSLFDKGCVRSMVVVGLEPHDSMIKGIEKLVSLDIQPMLSVFRPLEDTPLADLIAPPMKYLYDLYYEASEICARKGLHLGPKCVCCQNNTLSLPYSD